MVDGISVSGLAVMAGPVESCAMPSFDLSAEEAKFRQNLGALRLCLMALHKTLIDSEKTAYEDTFGEVPSPNAFLQLLISDPWFAWLHPISELVVVIDELLESKEAITSTHSSAIVKQTKSLLVASEEGQGFARSYFEALQREPDVVMAHAEVVKCLKGF
jgi:hypothetical protein